MEHSTSRRDELSAGFPLSQMNSEETGLRLKDPSWDKQSGAITKSAYHRLDPVNEGMLLSRG